MKLFTILSRIYVFFCLLMLKSCKITSTDIKTVNNISLIINYYKQFQNTFEWGKNRIILDRKKTNHKISSIYNIFTIKEKNWPNRVFIWPFFATFSVLNARFLCPICNILYYK